MVADDRLRSKFFTADSAVEVIAGLMVAGGGLLAIVIFWNDPNCVKLLVVTAAGICGSLVARAFLAALVQAGWLKR